MAGKVFKLKMESSEIEVKFVNPSQEEILDMDYTYRQVFSEALRKGIITENAARKIFQKDQSWTDEDDAEILDISGKISFLEIQLDQETGEGGDKEFEGNLKIIEKLIKLRRKLESKVGDKVMLFNNSAEGIAKDQRMHKLVRYCSYKVDDNKLFESDDDYQTFIIKEPYSAAQLIMRAYTFDMDVEDDVTNDFAESKYLKRVEENRAKFEKDIDKKIKKKNKRDTKKKITKKSKKVNAK